MQGAAAGPSSADAPNALTLPAGLTAPHTDGSRLSERGVGLRDVAPLPGRLDRPSVVVLADEANGFVGGYAVQNSKAGKCSARPTASAAAGDLDPFFPRTDPSLTQRLSRVPLVSWQPEIRPANPPLLPTHRPRRLAEQVQPEVRTLPVRHRSTQRTTPDKSTGRQTQQPGCRRVPHARHGLSVCSQPRRPSPHTHRPAGRRVAAG